MRNHLERLQWAVIGGMAIQAARMLQHLAGLIENGDRPRLPIDDRVEGRNSFEHHRL
jgi:hypothetical protein